MRRWSGRTGRTARRPCASRTSAASSSSSRPAASAPEFPPAVPADRRRWARRRTPAPSGRWTTRASSLRRRSAGTGSPSRPRGQYQDHSTIEVSDDITPGTEVETIHLGLRTFTVDLLSRPRSAPRGNGGLLGGDAAEHDQRPRPLVPDASTDGVAFFVVERLTAGRLGLLAGVRGDARTLLADSNTTLALGSQTRDATAITWDAGFTPHLLRRCAWRQTSAEPFRAPASSSSSPTAPSRQRRYEIGDPTPEAGGVAQRGRESPLAATAPPGRGGRVPRPDQRLRVSSARPGSMPAIGDRLLRVLAATARRRRRCGAGRCPSRPMRRADHGVGRAGDYVHGQNDAAGQPCR